MVQSAVVSLGLFVTSAFALGNAVVINKCPYDVYLCDVPAAGGGFNEADKTLSSGQTWSQQWTELSNGNGWSIKLSKSRELANIMQYEYTYHTSTPNIIWFDLSDVNGNPWDGNWEVSADDDSCNPKEQAYQFATDDAYGMQSCPSDSSITVTLCSGSDSSNSTSPDSSAPSGADTTVGAAAVSAAPSSTEAPSTTQAPATTAEATTVEAPPAPAAPTTTAAPLLGAWSNWGLGPDGAVIAEGLDKRDAAAPSLTTFATSVSQAPSPPAIAGRLGRRHEHAAQVHHHHRQHAA